MIVVTGGAGFIGSNIVKYLSEQLQEKVCVIDFETNLANKNLEKRKNIYKVSNKKLDYFLKKNQYEVKIIVHMGAITSTTETDDKLILQNNVELSIKLWEWCVEKKKRYIYASSAATYGKGLDTFRDIENIANLNKLKPLNLYGWSKHIVDKYFISESKNNQSPPQWVGLKFFNVYGPNEYHKGDMKSIVVKIYEKISQNKKVNLFKSHNKKYSDGEQLRDFVYIKDVVKVIGWFIKNEKVSGLFNLGSGKARSFNDLAKNVFKYLNKEKKVFYINTPKEIREKYQYYTQAEISKLRKVGYSESFFSLESGIRDYIVNHLNKKDKYN